MSKISRRGLFRLGAGAVAAPFIKPAPAEAIPEQAPTVFTANGVWIKPSPERVTIVAWGGGGGSGGIVGGPDNNEVRRRQLAHAARKRKR